MDEKRYTTERGIEIAIMPIPLLLDEVRKVQEAKIPAHPTYEAKTASGYVEIHLHNETTLQTDEEKEMWAEYQEAKAQATESMNDAIWRAVRLKAIRVDVPEGNGWIEDQEALGLTVPDDPRERRLHYIQTEVIGGVRDIVRVTAIANGADLDEGALAAAEESFRRAMAGQMEGAFAVQPETG